MYFSQWKIPIIFLIEVAIEKISQRCDIWQSVVPVKVHQTYNLTYFAFAFSIPCLSSVLWNLDKALETNPQMQCYCIFWCHFISTFKFGTQAISVWQDRMNCNWIKTASPDHLLLFSEHLRLSTAKLAIMNLPQPIFFSFYTELSCLWKNSVRLKKMC